jgi:hypothetical protein
MSKVDQWQSLNDNVRRKYTKKASRCPDPLTSVYNPDSNLGSITETLDDIIDNYTSQRRYDKSFDCQEFKVRIKERIFKVKKLKKLPRS